MATKSIADTRETKAGQAALAAVEQASAAMHAAALALRADTRAAVEAVIKREKLLEGLIKDGAAQLAACRKKWAKAHDDLAKGLGEKQRKTAAERVVVEEKLEQARRDLA